MIECQNNKTKDTLVPKRGFRLIVCKVGGAIFFKKLSDLKKNAKETEVL